MKAQRPQATASSVNLPFMVDGSTPPECRWHETSTAPFDFFALYRQSPFSVAVYTPDGRIVAANDAFLHLCEMRLDQLPSNYSVLRDPQFARAGVLPLMRRAFSGDSVTLPPIRYDPGVFTRSAAETRWLQGSMSPIFNENRGVAFVMHMLTDISPQVEEQFAHETAGELDLRLLREMEQGSLDFHAVFEQAPLSAAIFDMNGRVLMANLAFTREWGITVDQLPASYSVFRDPQFESAGVLPLVRQAFAGEVIALPPLQYDIGGLVYGHASSRWFQGVFHPVRDEMGVAQQVVMIHTDVSQQVKERLEREAAASIEKRRLHEILGEILERTADGVMHIDREWTLTYMNTSAVKLAGAHREWIGSGLWQSFPDASATVRAEYHKAMVERIPVELEDYYGGSLDKWFHIRVFPVSEGIAIHFQDVSERVRVENRLRDSERQAVVGRLTASIAQEISDPLESVANLLHVLQNESNMSPGALQYLDLAQQELHRAALINRNTLKLSLESERPSYGSLIEIMGSVLTLLKGRLEQRGVRLTARYRAHSDFTCYPADLRRVFAAFIANAIDASASGGSIYLRVRPTANALRGEPGILVTIADTGRGLDPQAIAHLHDSSVATSGWTGADSGLWVSAELIRKHAGRIRVRSRQCTHWACGGGTVFQIALPYSNRILP